MGNLIHRSPSVGGLVKKIMDINPELGIQEIVQLIRMATRSQGKMAGDYEAMEIVDEKQALALAQSTLKQNG
jgi:hypothetical protein